LGTNWVLTEKVKMGITRVKARSCARGDQENTDDVQTDSPTVRKGHINILRMLAARNNWVIRSQDVTSAFLKSIPIERRVPGVLWKLKKTVYGLVDASRGFYLNFSGYLVEKGCQKSKMDPAMFIYFKGKQESVCKEPDGVAVTHVDDVMSAGEETFKMNVHRGGGL
jgi:hypothetical protein